MIVGCAPVSVALLVLACGTPGASESSDDDNTNGDSNTESATIGEGETNATETSDSASETTSDPTDSTATGDTDTTGTSDATSETGVYQPNVRLVVEERLDLCANTTITTDVPDAFLLTAQMEIAAGAYNLGPRVEWPMNEDGIPEGDRPPGRELDLGVRVRFPNVRSTFDVFGSGNWAPIADLDIWGSARPGLVWFSSSRSLRGEDSAINNSSVRIDMSSTPDELHRIFLRPPRTRYDAENFEVRLACGMNLGDPCRIGERVLVNGIMFEFVPCDMSSAPIGRLIAETSRGTFTFELRVTRRLSEQYRPLALFEFASGEFDGQAFEQDDPMQLAASLGGVSVQSPPHTLGALFPAPIDGVCGFMLANFDAPPQSPTNPYGRIAYEVTCDLQKGAAFEFLSYTQEEVDP